MRRKNLLGLTPLLMAADASFSQYENAHRRTYSDPPYNKGEDTKNKIIYKKIIFTNDKGQMQTKRIKMTLKEFREIQSECNKTSKTIEEFLIEKEKENTNMSKSKLDITVLEHIAEAKKGCAGFMFERYYNRRQFFKATLNKFEVHNDGVRTLSPEAAKTYIYYASNFVPDTIKCYGLQVSQGPDGMITIYKLNDLPAKYIEFPVDGFAMQNPDDGEMYFIFTTED